MIHNPQLIIVQTGFLQIIIKLTTAMSAAEHYSSLRNRTNGEAVLAQSKGDLKSMVRQRELTIGELSKRIEARRGEMKGLSRDINVLIEKREKKPPKEGPSNFGSHFSIKLKNLHRETEAMYRQGQEVKAQIAQLKQEQPQQIVKEIESNQSQMLMLVKKQTKIDREKHILMEQLQRNKERIMDLKQNSCLNDLEEREKQYQEVRRECKQNEKSLNIASADYLQTNYYYQLMREVIGRQPQPQKEDNSTIYQSQIAVLASYLNTLALERKTLEKETDIKRLQLMHSRVELQKQIRQRQVGIRQLQNDILRAGIESRRTTSFKTLPTKTKVQQKPAQKTYNPEITPKKKVTMVNKVYMIQREEEKVIVVGDWNSQGMVFGDRGQSWQSSVERTNKITFLIANHQLVGVRSSYSDRDKALIEGRTLLTQGIHSYSELQVSLDEVITIQYSAKNSPLYLKFIDLQGSSQSVGQKREEDSIERISMDQYMIKWVEGQIGDSLEALRLHLEDRPIEQKVIAQEIGDKGPITQRSFSNATLGPRKVILKGRSLSKLKDGPIIDHRLMLSKNRMV